MKKKIISLCLVVALGATAVIGGTLAYFTDTDAETNVFTYGNVSIDLKEDFVQESKLKPGMDVNKDAWIVNDGNEDAYVWAEILIPSALDDNDDNSPAAPGLGNSLHFNYPGMYAAEYAQNKDANAKWYNEDLSKLWYMQHNADDVSYGYMGTELVGDVTYNKFICLYKDVLKAGEATSYFMDKVYMDSKVTQAETDGYLVLADGSTQYNGPWQIVVRAYGIQAEGFNSVVEAWKAFDGNEPAVKENGAL